VRVERVIGFDSCIRPVSVFVQLHLLEITGNRPTFLEPCVKLIVHRGVRQQFRVCFCPTIEWLRLFTLLQFQEGVHGESVVQISF
jgi:hypothetical protein